MTVEIEEYSSAKRRLILRDSVTFLILILITAVLFAITLFLFRSFMAHRQELAQRWSERGRAAIQAGHPDQAVVAFRTALSYATDERPYELLLAQALGDAGRLDESYNYFQGLWETTPGDGFINLRLAQLAVKKNDRQTATNYYRAAIYGTWEGDATARRRDIRLELARYLIAQQDANGARAELLIVGGNNSNDSGVILTVADLLKQAGSGSDALHFYHRTLALEPENVTALEGIGRLQYEAGNFAGAYTSLEQAARERGAEGVSSDIEIIRDHAKRILELAPAKKLPDSERVTRILKLREIAKRRFDSCSAQGASIALQELGPRWSGRQGTVDRRSLMKDRDEQDAVVTLAFDTERQAASTCGAPIGDDAMIVLLAGSPQTMEP